MACVSPYSIFVKSRKRAYNVPCRHCQNCLNRRALDIADVGNFYNYMCIKQGLSSSFITLTYNDSALPRSADTMLPTLCRDELSEVLHDAQDKSKRLYGHSFKYVACGEYGDDGKRPHYHVAAFGLGEGVAQDVFHNLWTTDTQGIIDIGSLSPGGINYISKYMEKSACTPEVAQVYYEAGIQKPFLVHSQNLAKEFFQAFYEELTGSNFTTDFYGIRTPLPGYYRRRLDRFKNYQNLDVMKRLKLEADFTNLDVHTYSKEQALLHERIKIQQHLSRGKPVDKSAYELEALNTRSNTASALAREAFDPIPF